MVFCSTIIPTVGRPELSRAVQSVLQQEFPPDDFEIIVVNDSGKPLPTADWMQAPQVKVVHTQRRERSVARNTGAAIAEGRYLHFLDDDDWLLPGAFQTLWRLATQHPHADQLYGATQLVDRAGSPLIQLKHTLSGNCFCQTMAGEWIPLQSSMIKSSAFFTIGGFHPLISGTEDVDLLRRITLQGDVAGSLAVVACVGMGTAQSTTNHSNAPHLSRWARELILIKSGVLSRLIASAETSSWRGRAARIYLTSAIWNLKRQRFITAASRGVFGLSIFVRSGQHVSTSEFWDALIRSYASETFETGFAAARSQRADSR